MATHWCENNLASITEYLFFTGLIYPGEIYRTQGGYYQLEVPGDVNEVVVTLGGLGFVDVQGMQDSLNDKPCAVVRFSLPQDPSEIYPRISFHVMAARTVEHKNPCTEMLWAGVKAGKYQLAFDGRVLQSVHKNGFSGREYWEFVTQDNPFFKVYLWGQISVTYLGQGE